MEKDFEIIKETGTHYYVRLPVDLHDLVVMIDKTDFTITIPVFEYMYVESIVKIIAGLCNDKELLKNPVITNFLSMLQKPENKEELQNLQKVYREL